MIISETCRSETKIFCLLCGTNNVTEEAKITPCPHLEGLGSSDGINYDKNGILKKAADKAAELTEQMIEMVNVQSKQLDDEYDKNKEHTKEESEDYWKKMNPIIKECYKLVGCPKDIPVEQINGIHISILDVLKNQLDDNYFVFFTWEPMPSGYELFYLYHLVESDMGDGS
jgi:late competence protein required for DNA uptake (superfamily II DNA/RNA helicase)